MAELLSNVDLGRSSKSTVKISPSVLINIMESNFRSNPNDTVFGILLGDDMPHEILVTNCFFSTPLKSGSLNLDTEYLKTLSGHMKKLNPKEQNLGFFLVSNGLDKTVVKIYETLTMKLRSWARTNDTVILLIDPELSATPKITGYANVKTNSKMFALFQEINVEIASENIQRNQKVTASVYSYDKLPASQQCPSYDSVVEALSDIISNLSTIIEVVEKVQKKNETKDTNIARAVFNVTEIGMALSTYPKSKIQEMIQAYTQDILTLSFYAKLAKANVSISHKLTEQIKIES